eukprot:2494542-Prymnesium_polylepis.1
MRSSFGSADAWPGCGITRESELALWRCQKRTTIRTTASMASLCIAAYGLLVPNIPPRAWDEPAAAPMIVRVQFTPQNVRTPLQIIFPSSDSIADNIGVELEVDNGQSLTSLPSFEVSSYEITSFDGVKAPPGGRNDGQQQAKVEAAVIDAKQIDAESSKVSLDNVLRQAHSSLNKAETVEEAGPDSAAKAKA